jgi:hypothetical protein
MEQELAEYNEDRNRQFAILLEKQRCELSQIDNEITNLGINVADLAETMQDIHFFAANTAVHFAPHDRQILSSNVHMNNNRTSTNNLPRSYSSNSFVSNTSNGHGTTAYK